MNLSGMGQCGADARRYLLISRVGLRSLHDGWLVDAGLRNFDVFLSAYDKGVQPVAGSGVFFEYRPGPKVERYNEILRDYSSFLRRYKYVCLFDEDLETSADTLNELFSLSESLGVKISQPSLTWDSYFTYAALLKQPGVRLRYINYVEMMCPVFRQDVLQKMAPLYSMGAESGIDLVWCNLVFDSEKDFAVFDSLPVKHTEPVGGRKKENGFLGGKTYEDDIFRILNVFDIPWISCVPYSAITISGKEVSGRFWKLLYAMSIFLSIPLRKGWGGRLRAVVVHFKHLILRKPTNIKIGYPADAF